jgi:hypothetical protein
MAPEERLVSLITAGIAPINKSEKRPVFHQHQQYAVAPRDGVQISAKLTNLSEFDRPDDVG